MPAFVAAAGSRETHTPSVGTAAAARVSGTGSGIALPRAPQVRGKKKVVELTLRAVTGPDGQGAFSFNGAAVPPTIRVSPGDTLKITYVNAMSRTAAESCAGGPCTNMTNLHFHGLGVSPKPAQDDVLGMMAMPGETLHYAVAIPPEQAPGLYWYHTHPHGESERQALDGMSGAIVVEGIDRYVPEVGTMPERVLIIRGRDIEHAPEAASLRRQVGIPEAPCGSAKGSETPERIMTVNGVVRPEIPMAPGQRQFWRIVNAGADTYADVQIDGQPLDVVALDGIPTGFYDAPAPAFPAPSGLAEVQRRRPYSIKSMDHRLVPPGGRLEVRVTGPPAGSRFALRTRCVDTGPDGDPNPEMVLADLTSVPSAALGRGGPAAPPARSRRRPDPRHAPIEEIEKTRPDFVATFTEDKEGFYINGQKFSVDAKPMLEVDVGTYQHWRVVNDTDEIHPMHLHQVHFLAYAQNGVSLADPVWVDTVNVPYRGTVDMIVDLTDPVIRGMSVFHCHLLNHEDKGMMAKVLFR
jgi:FtsP/CotA-like multicopper oxidase with cupredoxin domain